MTEIRWTDGLIESPDGIARQLPERHVFSSAVYVTRDGVARRRFFNPVDQSWRWAQEPILATLDSEGRVGYTIGWFRSIDHCTALAWLQRGEGSSAGVRERVAVELVDGPQRAPQRAVDTALVDSLEWPEPEDTEEDGALRGEKWRTLKWRAGLIPCGNGYQISTFGRLKSPYTQKVTKGFWAAGTRFAALRDGVLVDLLAAAGLQPEHHMTPRIRLGLDALMSGYTPRQLADAIGVQQSTSWNYFTQGAEKADAETLRQRVRRLIPPELWRALQSLAKNGDVRLGSSLLELQEVLRTLLPSSSAFWKDEHGLAKLRLARISILLK
jgi:hypothetical protein